MSHNGVEREVKIRISEISGFQKDLERCGFRLRAARQFESNSLYDTADQALRRDGAILRLRQSGKKSVITWKGPGEPGPFKTRAELETAVDSLDMLRQILERLGYREAFRYEKFRTEYEESGDPEAGILTIDETPIGNFMELEGSGDWIDRKAQELGFSRKDYVLSSYGKLYLDECERYGVQPTNMVFASHSQW
jgi:adenylate cyclase class 2